MEPTPQGKQPSEALFVFVALLTLASFVVAQTVYEILAANPDFLAVREVSGGQLLLIIGVFSVLPAAALFLVWAGLLRLSRMAARVFFCLLCSFLFFAFLLQVHNNYVLYSEAWMNFWLAVGVLRFTYLAWVPVGVLLGFSYLRYEKTFRIFLWALSPAIVLFPVLFLWRAWPETTAGAEPMRAAQPAAMQQKDVPPIFILVLDELSLPMLLDASGGIDAKAFPNLHALAADSHWFRNATANADHTLLSVPVILTGNYPKDAAASYRRYPDTLFTLLEPYYEIHAREASSKLCNPRRFHCPEVEIAANWRELLRDVFLLYLVRQLPKDSGITLPVITRTWGPFYSHHEVMQARMDRFNEFLQWLPAVKPERTLVYFHELNPHSPYMMTAGREIVERSPIQFEPEQKGNETLLRALREHYREQIVFTDEEVGRLVARLKELGWYEQSLFILVGDHGVSSSSEAPGRFLHDGADADQVLRVPLFIKLPRQKQGVVSDADVQHVDILPTVAAVLGLGVPWTHPGRNAFSEKLESRKRVVYDHMDGRHEFPSKPGVRLSATPEPGKGK
ncbi:MAG: sulfatase-like hydrolase/transferase [Acidobacteria bacterium]|nr:sulfatase-like hydrolase/transferase [Acidobacteriota bacterium]